MIKLFRGDDGGGFGDLRAHKKVATTENGPLKFGRGEDHSGHNASTHPHTHALTHSARFSTWYNFICKLPQPEWTRVVNLPTVKIEAEKGISKKFLR